MAECLENIDAVVHLAALSGVIDSVEDPRPSFELNVVGSFQLLGLARAAGVACFINASTGGALLGESAVPISEAMAPNPLSPYGASKLAIEGYCSAFSAAYGQQLVRADERHVPVVARKAPGDTSDRIGIWNQAFDRKSPSEATAICNEWMTKRLEIVGASSKLLSRDWRMRIQFAVTQS